MRYLPLFVLFALIAACTGNQNLQQVLHQDDHLRIELDQRKISATPAFEGPFSHPVNIPPKVLKKILKSIRVKPQEGTLMSLFSKKNLEPLFSAENLDLVAQQFSHALAAAKPAERVNFYLMTPLKTKKVAVTAGFILVKAGRFHIRVKHHKVPLRKGVHPSRAGLGMKSSEKAKYSFSLAEGEQMRHRRYKNILGLPGSDARWLVIDYVDFPDTSGKADTTTTPPPATIEERLRTLKHLREEKLITEKEYLEKKRTLLKAF